MYDWGEAGVRETRGEGLGMVWAEVLMRYCKETADLRDPAGEQLLNDIPRSTTLEGNESS